MKKISRYTEIRNAFIVGNVIFIIFLIIGYVKGDSISWNVNLRNSYIENMIYTFILYFTNSVVFRYYLKKYEKRFFLKENIWKGIFGGILVTLVAIFLIRLFGAIVFDGKTFNDFVANESVKYYRVSFLITMSALSVFYAIWYWKSKQESQVQQQKIIARTASAQFDALKNQLDPHFLFNSLNVLTSLIEESPIQAQKFTTSLSKVYRYVLEQKNKELVTVDEELKFARTYVNLLKMRFEDSIHFDLPEKASNPEAKVVPLSLQLLLENAVKHNMVMPSKPLHIRIEEENGNLVVKNNLQPKQVVKKSSGVGLTNIQQRYYLLTAREVQIKKTASEFSVSIPMLTKQVSNMKTQETYIEDKRYARAKERIQKIKEFYIHFGIYLIMVPVFIFINYKSTSFPWAIFPIVGWGFGVAGHAMESFNYHPFLGKNWEDRKIKEFMEKDNF